MVGKQLYEFSQIGRDISQERDPEKAQRRYEQWVDDVGDWLNEEFQETGLAISWLGLNSVNLVFGDHFHDNPAGWAAFRNAIDLRLNWLSKLYPEYVRRQTPEEAQSKALSGGRREVQLNKTARAFVDPSRIEELKNIEPNDFDFTKLIRLCEELNICYAGECYLACSMLTRAILDHVAPVFSCRNFAEVANNYGGTRSFRESMKNLETSSRKISDQHLHTQIRRSEVLPNAKQVDFGSDLDVLLAEIVRVQKNQGPPSSTATGTP